MRLVMFGPCDAACAALRDPAAAAYLAAVAGDNPAPAQESAPELVAAGLLAPDGGGYRPTDRVLRLDELDVAAPAAHIAGLVRAGLDDLAALPEAQGLSWQRAGFAVVAGLLLDLAVSEELCAAGAVPASPPQSHVWLLGAAEFSFGVHCVYDPAVRTGAGVVWATSFPPASGAVYPELPAHLTAASTDPAVRLRLRYLGWLRGDEPAFVTWIRGNRDPVARLARRLAVDVYLPLLDGLSYAEPDPRRHAVGRLLMERAVTTLLSAGAIACGPDDLRRIRWLGDNLLLAGPSEDAGA